MIVSERLVVDGGRAGGAIAPIDSGAVRVYARIRDCCRNSNAGTNQCSLIGPGCDLWCDVLDLDAHLSGGAKACITDRGTVCNNGWPISNGRCIVVNGSRTRSQGDSTAQGAADTVHKDQIRGCGAAAVADGKGVGDGVTFLGRWIVHGHPDVELGLAQIGQA